MHTKDINVTVCGFGWKQTIVDILQNNSKFFD